ncbi:MAG: hypothetical protein O8C67_09600 [Candidatus Methanoperedens sp.]|nr:hypothetical protein [Candidatus Methanoperedens sp.]
MSDNKIKVLSERILISAGGVTECPDLCADVINVEEVEVDADDIVICDLCNDEIGEFKNLKKENIVSPEKIVKVIKRGLLPTKIIDFLSDEHASKEYLAQQWRNMSLSTETPWALCDHCLEEVNAKLRKNLIRFGNILKHNEKKTLVDYATGKIMDKDKVMVTFEYGDCQCPQRRVVAWTKYEIVDRISNDVLDAIKHNRKFITFNCPMCHVNVKMPVDT